MLRPCCSISHLRACLLFAAGLFFLCASSQELVADFLPQRPEQQGPPPTVDVGNRVPAFRPAEHGEDGIGFTKPNNVTETGALDDHIVSTEVDCVVSSTSQKKINGSVSLAPALKSSKNVTVEKKHERKHHRYSRSRVESLSPWGIWYWTLSAMLVIFAGVASGLTVGLMSLDPVQLKVLAEEGTEEQKEGVRQVSQIIQRHHLLLVTLLLANSIAMETLPIFLDRLVPSWAAVLLSVTAILLFGEIIPQALCTGPNQLRIAQSAAPFVNVLVGSLFIVSWPIARLLDYLLGGADHPSYYARAHLKALIRLHERERRIREAYEAGELSDASSGLGPDEVVVIEGALDLATKKLGEIMLPLDKVFMLEANTPLNRDTFNRILESGHSRIPVYSKNRNNLCGLLLTKWLLAIDPQENIRAGDYLVERRPIFSSPETNVYDLLNEFQKGHSHIAFVTKQVDDYVKAFKSKQSIPPHATIVGIATLEDVIEELIQEEIYDEFDHKAVRPTIKKIREAAAVPATALRKRSVPLTAEQINEIKADLKSDWIASAVPVGGSTRELPEVVRGLSRDSSMEKKPSKKYGGASAGFSTSVTVPLVTAAAPTCEAWSPPPREPTATRSETAETSSQVKQLPKDLDRPRRALGYKSYHVEGRDNQSSSMSASGRLIHVGKRVDRSDTWGSISGDSATPRSPASQAALGGSEFAVLKIPPLLQRRKPSVLEPAESFFNQHRPEGRQAEDPGRGAAPAPEEPGGGRVRLAPS